MENLSKNKLEIFKGAGWLLGLATAIVGSIVVYVLSNNFGAAISAALPIGVAMGIGFEQKFQGKNERTDPKRTKNMIISLLFGFVIFIALFFIFKLF